METDKQNNYNNEFILKYNNVESIQANKISFKPFKSRNFGKKHLATSSFEPIDLTSYKTTMQSAPCTADTNKYTSPLKYAYSKSSTSYATMPPTKTNEKTELEILQAAKTLFCKRTRTLYHWMYPHASVNALKVAVVSAWEKLNPREKEFYVSQALGRFELNKSNVIVNPHLTCGLVGLEKDPLDLSNEINLFTSESFEESTAAVSNLLLSEKIDVERCVPMSSVESSSRMFERKRRKVGRPVGSKTKMIKIEKEEIEDDVIENDPELQREFEQFQWTMKQNYPHISLL